MDCRTPGFPVLHHLPEFAQTHVHWVSDAIQPSHPLLPPYPFAFNLSQHQAFSSLLALHIRWSKYSSFSISPSNEYSGLISLRIARFNLAVQGTLKSLLQHHSSKALILQHSTFFMVQLSYMLKLGELSIQELWFCFCLEPGVITYLTLCQNLSNSESQSVVHGYAYPHPTG